MLHRKTELRRWSWCIMQIDSDSHSTENICGCCCECPAVIPCIKTNCYASLCAQFFTICGKQISSESGSCLTNCIFIHTVGSCSHDSSKAAGTKFQIFIETVFYLFFILQAGKFSSCLFIKECIFFPLLISFFVSHKSSNKYTPRHNKPIIQIIPCKPQLCKF